MGGPASYNVIKDLLPPDLPNGGCQTTKGRTVMDEVIDSPSNLAAVLAARILCAHCPVKQECLAWVKQAEDPGGSWQGVYAGLTQAERKKRAKQLAQEKALLEKALSGSS